jgi:predicted TIM-barrel enzyme
VLERTADCHGFYGASSMERLPTETALVEQTRAFKNRLTRPRSDPALSAERGDDA